MKLYVIVVVIIPIAYIVFRIDEYATVIFIATVLPWWFDLSHKDTRGVELNTMYPDISFACISALIYQFLPCIERGFDKLTSINPTVFIIQTISIFAISYVFWEKNVSLVGNNKENQVNIENSVNSNDLFQIFCSLGSLVLLVLGCVVFRNSLS